MLQYRDPSTGSVKTLSALKGTDGKSAYQYAKESGYTGSEQEFAKLLADNSTVINNLQNQINELDSNMQIQLAGKASTDIATQTNSGLMSPEDKVKLDNIDPNNLGSGGGTAEAVLVTIPTTGWSETEPYSISITMDGTIDNVTMFHLVPAGEEATSDEMAAVGLITGITVNDNIVTIEATEIPSIGFTIALVGANGDIEYSPADYAALVGRIDELTNNIEALMARVAVLEGNEGGSTPVGYSVDFTNTDTRERWTDEETHYGSGGDFYFKINGTQYDVQDTSVLVKYTGVTSFEVMGTNHSYGSQDMSMTYITGADGLVNTVTWTSDEQDVWKTIDVTWDIEIVSFEYSSCLTGDTMITMANGTEKRLDTLEKGDMVIAVHPETHELVPAKLLYCNRLATPQYAPQYDVWTFEDGSVVKTVKRHRLYNVDRQAMVYMDEWQIGERAYNKNGEYIALTNHETVVEKVQHFTLFTEYQNYFVNGILAGNRLTPEILL